MRRMIIAAASAAALSPAVPATAHAQQLPPEVQSVVDDAGSGSSGIGLPDPRAYLDGLNGAVGSSGSPELNTALTLLGDWAVGAVLIAVGGGLLATFL